MGTKRIEVGALREERERTARTVSGTVALALVATLFGFLIFKKPGVGSPSSTANRSAQPAAVTEGAGFERLPAQNSP